jgi:LMBR1 domain-containing protein 1
MLSWMREKFKVEFDELACDFIYSIEKKWYLVNVRGYYLFLKSKL